MKTCTRCQLRKPAAAFYSHPTTRDGLSSWCRVCTCAERKAVAERDPEAHREKARRWYWANRERAIARTTRSRKRWGPQQKARHREVNFNSMLRRKYGLTREAWEHMIAQQNGLCAICGLPPEIKDRGTTRTKSTPWVVDHNHSTGQVRELLCGRCNTLVGFIELNPHLVPSALNYLKRHEPQTPG
jgi:hypothetical protein